MVVDETGVYKNLLQEISQRVGAPLPHYTTYRSGLGHQPVFTGKVELAGIIFTGEPAKNKKQAEKNAALASWQSLKQLAQQSSSSSSEQDNSDELEQVTIARALLNFRVKEKMINPSNTPLPFPQTFPIQNPRPSSPQRPAVTASKILPLICPKKTPPRVRPTSSPMPDITSYHSRITESRGHQPQKFLGVGAAPYIPIRHGRAPCHGFAPPVTVRNAVPCYAAPPVPPSSTAAPPLMRAGPPNRMAPPVCIRQSVPVFSALPVRKEDPLKSVTASEKPDKESSTVKETKDSELDVASVHLTNVGPSMITVPPAQIAPPVCIRQAVPVCAAPPARNEDPSSWTEPNKPRVQAATKKTTQDSKAVEKLEQLKI